MFIYLFMSKRITFFNEEIIRKLFVMRIIIIIILYFRHCLVKTYRVSREERTKLREGVPYVKVYRCNLKHLYPKLNGYRDNGQRSLKL